MAIDMTWKINGTAIPTPGIDTKYTEEDAQLTAYRDENGLLHKNTVAWGKRKVECVWPILTNDEINLLRKLTKNSEYVTLTYYNTQDGTSGTISQCYTGDLTYKLHTYALNNEPMWLEVGLNFIER